MIKLTVTMGLMLAAAVVLGLGNYALNPNDIPLIGYYPVIEYGPDSIIVPPSAEEGDPPFVNLKQAYGKYHDPGTIFLDSREPEDYQAGCIKGALCLPFDWFDDYWPDVEPLLSKDAQIIIYCSGAECELSLYEARYLRELGYEQVFIFFGGWSEWESHGFPTEIPVQESAPNETI
jgi:rhodanese-related sulfurtransferase